MKKYEIIDPDIVLADHQIRAVKFIKSRKACCINYETGSGKTFISLEAAFRMFEEDLLDKVLVICTKSSIQSFEDDITKTNYPPRRLIIIKDIEDLLDNIDEDKNKIFILQYETLQRIRLIEILRAFKRYRSALIIDEVHRVKSAGKTTRGGKSKESITAQSLVTLKRSFDYLVGLTATTITSKLEDAYRILSYIKPGILGGYKWFEETFCVMEEGQRWNKKIKKMVPYRKVIRYKNLDKFLKYTKPIMIQYFPELDYRFHTLSKSLDPESKRGQRYEEITASVGGDDEEIAHSSAMPRLQRLVDKSPAKRFLLKKLIERCRDDGLIVYSRTRKAGMLEYIQEILEEEGMQVQTIKGKTPREKRKEIQRWCFKGSPKDKALIITDAAGQSMNLQWTHNLIFFEIPMGIGRFLQIKGRIGRMFSRWKWFDFYFLLIKNTIDEYWYMRFTCNKELLKFTGSDIAIPKAKLNTFNERKLKKERDAKVWRKGYTLIQGNKKQKASKPISSTAKLKGVKRINKK